MPEPSGTVAVVHTRGSPCLCHAAILDALEGAGIRSREIDADSLPERSDLLAGCRFAFDQTDTYRGGGDRAVVAECLRAAGVEVIGTPADVARNLDDKCAARESMGRAGVPLAPAGPSMRWPRVVKACRFHGSRNVRLVRTPADEEHALRDLGREVVVEEYVAGKEIAVGLVGRSRVRAFPPVEIWIGSEIYSHDEKWGTENPRVSKADLPSRVSADILGRLSEGYARLGIRDMARFDLRVRPDGSWVVLEVNVRPSLESDALLAAAASLDGISPHDLILGLLAAAGGPGRRIWD